MDDPVNGGAADVVSPGYLTETLPEMAITQDGLSIQNECGATDGSAFQFGAPHAGADSLDDQVAFQFSDGADDDDDGPAQRTAGIDLLAKADELDVEPAQFIEHL